MTAMNKETSLESMKINFLDEFLKFKGTTLSGDPRVYADDIDNFEIRDDDVWLCGFMRSGTNWAKEMIWRIANDINIENTALLRQRFPCFDSIMLNHVLLDLGFTYDDNLKRLKSLPSPRFLKTHLPFHLLPEQLQNGEKEVKMIYIARNPKDVCVSLYYFYKHFYNFKGNLEEMCDLFITDELLYAPYWDNVLGFWQKRKEFNILFLKYEDMKHDLPSVIRKTAEFLGRDLTDHQVTALSAHLSFEKCQQNPSITNQDLAEMYKKRFNHKESTGYLRKGTVEQWKQDMLADTVRRLDDWMEKNLQNSDYEI